MKPINLTAPSGTSLRVYCDAKQGGRMYMEDVLCAQTHTPEAEITGSQGDKDCMFFAVFDGHGGSEAAHFAEDNLKDEIVRQPGFWSDDDNDVMSAIKEGFISTHHMMPKAIGNLTDFVIIFISLD